MWSMSEAASPLLARRGLGRGEDRHEVPEELRVEVPARRSERRGRAAPCSRGRRGHRLGQPCAHSTSRWGSCTATRRCASGGPRSGAAPSACTGPPRPTRSTRRASTSSAWCSPAGWGAPRPRGASLRPRATCAPGTRRRATRDARGARPRWEARLVVLELPDVRELVRDPEGAGGDVVLASPRVRDPRLARRFLELHAALERPAWRLERDTLLQEWLCALAGARRAATAPRAARRDPGVAARVRADGRRPRAQPRARGGRRGGRREPPPPDAAVPGRLRPAAAPLRARPAHPRRPAAARARRRARRGRRADRLLRPEPPAPPLHAHARDDAGRLRRRAALRRTRRARRAA